MLLFRSQKKCFNPLGSPSGTRLLLSCFSISCTGFVLVYVLKATLHHVQGVSQQNGVWMELD